jgi:hypothetical protein
VIDPDRKKFPFASVVPIWEVTELLAVPEVGPVTVTGAFGGAPEIVTVQVSPGCKEFPPRLVTNDRTG